MTMKKLATVRVELKNVLNILKQSHSQPLSWLDSSISDFSEILTDLGIINPIYNPEIQRNVQMVDLQDYCFIAIYYDLVKSGHSQPSAILGRLIGFYFYWPFFIETYYEYRYNKPSIMEGSWRKKVDNMVIQLEEILRELS